MYLSFLDQILLAFSTSVAHQQTFHNGYDTLNRFGLACMHHMQPCRFNAPSLDRIVSDCSGSILGALFFFNDHLLLSSHEKESPVTVSSDRGIEADHFWYP